MIAGKVAKSLRTIRPLLGFFCIATLLSSISLPANAQSVFPAAERVVAIGDIHGDFDNYKTVLTQAGLINRRGNWIGGETHFVQLGDLPDRGPDTDKVIEHMKKIELQAEEAGGKVHALIGNHEAMNIYGDLRYVTPEEFAAFRSSRSRNYREQYYDRNVEALSAADATFVADEAFEEQWLEQHPLGFVEHRIAWAADGDIGSWVTQHNAMVKIGRTLFLHGGVSPKLLTMSIDEINQQIQSELKGNLPEEAGLSEADDGPLWYRGLATAAEEIEAAHVDAALAAFDVDRIVIGHTPGMGTILPRFGGKVLVIDAGIADYYGGHLASLLIESSDYFTVQNGEKTKLPNSENEEIAYFEAISSKIAVTPQLQQHLENLRANKSSPP